LRLLVLFIWMFSQLDLAGQNLLGITGGIQFPGARYEIFNKPQLTQRIIGYQAGIQMKIPFDVNLYFVPAIRFQQRGFDVQLNTPNSLPDSAAIDNQVRMQTIEMAVYLQYDLGKNPTHAFIRLGPSLEGYFSGTEQFLKNNGELVKRPLSFARGNYGRYAANLLSEFGVETRSGWFVYAFYAHGVANISNRDLGPTINPRSFGINIGKFLNSKKIVIDTRNIE